MFRHNVPKLFLAETSGSLIGNPTPCKRFSSGSFSCQQNVQFCSLLLPFDGRLVSSSAEMSMLSFLSSWLIMAVLLASSTWYKSCERPGHKVLTSQLVNRIVVYYHLFLLLLGAWFTVCSPEFALTSKHTLNQADGDGSAPTGWELPSVRQEVADQWECNAPSHRWRQPVAS